MACACRGAPWVPSPSCHIGVNSRPTRKMTEGELTRALRMCLSAEEEAVHLYEALADATEDALAKKVLKDIADEEKEGR